ncbi:MAG TPA: potassium transporter Kef, partial [Pseudonocardiaceae bacterium]|nr:potassium transporter Kef [Pseudonocardiaceae bacterium]
MDVLLVDPIRMPESGGGPGASLVRRFSVAIGALLACAFIVYFGRDGYVDNNSDTPITFLDALYYST